MRTTLPPTGPTVARPGGLRVPMRQTGRKGQTAALLRTAAYRCVHRPPVPLSSKPCPAEPTALPPPFSTPYPTHEQTGNAAAGFVGGPGGALAWVRAPFGPPLLARLGPRAPSGRGAQTLQGVRACPGAARPSLPGPVGPGSPGLFSPLRPRRCPRPCGGRAGAPSGPWAGAPAPAGAACPPSACRPSRSPFDCGLPRGGSALLSPPGPPGCAPRPRAPPRLRGGPGARLGPPRAAFVPPPLPPRGARAACGPRLLGALRPPRRRRTGVLAAQSGGKCSQKKVKAAAPTKRGKTAQGTLAARLGAGSVRSQLRYGRLKQSVFSDRYSLGRLSPAPPRPAAPAGGSGERKAGLGANASPVAVWLGVRCPTWQGCGASSLRHLDYSGDSNLSRVCAPLVGALR